MKDIAREDASAWDDSESSGHRFFPTNQVRGDRRTLFLVLGIPVQRQLAAATIAWPIGGFEKKVRGTAIVRRLAPS